MAQVITFDPAALIPGQVIGYYSAVDAAAIPTANKLVFMVSKDAEPAEIVALKAALVPQSRWVVDTGHVRAMTAEEIALVDADNAAKALAALKAAIADMLTDVPDAQKKGLRICFEVIIELFVAQLNTLRQNPTTTYAALTESAVKTAFYNAITAKIAAIT